MMVDMYFTKNVRNAGLNKFNAQRAHYAGTIYASRMEADHAARLDMLKGAKDPKERVTSWKAQQRFPMVVNGKPICVYVADFVVTFADGRTEVNEVKGMDTPVWRLKKKLFEALYPDLTLKVIH